MQLQFCHLSTCYLHVGAFNRQDKEMCIAYYAPYVGNGGPRIEALLLFSQPRLQFPGLYM